MNEPPILGTHGEPPEPEERLDGVVLFDPTPPPPREEPADPPPPKPNPLRTVAMVSVPLLLAAGAYALYSSGVLATPDGEGVPLPPVVTLEGSVPAAALVVPGGETIAALAGSSVTLAVRATGSGGVPLPDTSVAFEVVRGSGVLDPGTSTTDAGGTARTELALPTRVGTVVIAARIVGSDVETRLTVEARAGAPERVAVAAGNGQEAEVGDLLPLRSAVQVLDAAGNPVPGAEVRFSASADGMAAPSRTRTDSLGQASALWRLGMETGPQQLTALAVDLGSSVTFTATALPRPTLVESREVPVEAGPVSVVANEFVIGGSHVCALVGGQARCRGANDRGQIAARSVGLRAIATGVSHVCGLNATGEALCWGGNEGGQLGDGTRTDRPSPVVVRTDLRFSTLTAGASHTCGLAGGGVPVCWGQNLNGQLGDGSRTDAWAPRTVGGGLSFRSLVAGWNHTCGLTSNGNAFCWGLNSEGQLGDGSQLDRLVPTLVRGAIESLAAGSTHTCGISGAEVLCWGDNRFGQLGDGTTESHAQPSPATALPGTPIQLAVGAVHTCALLGDGSVHCWGQNLHGQLGDGTTVNRSSPTRVGSGLRFSALHAGGALTCAFAEDGPEYCWGLNQNGQLGDGTRESRSTPTRIGG